MFDPEQELKQIESEPWFYLYVQNVTTEKYVYIETNFSDNTSIIDLFPWPDKEFWTWDGRHRAVGRKINYEKAKILIDYIVQTYTKEKYPELYI